MSKPADEVGQEQETNKRNETRAKPQRGNQAESQAPRQNSDYTKARHTTANGNTGDTQQ